MRIFNEPVTVSNSGDMSQATLTSNSIALDHMGLAAIQAVYTGSPVGSLKLQANVGGSTWTDVASSTVSVTAAGDNMWNLADIGYSAVRVVYTKTSGTGTLSVRANCKGF